MIILWVESMRTFQANLVTAEALDGRLHARLVLLVVLEAADVELVPVDRCTDCLEDGLDRVRQLIADTIAWDQRHRVASPVLCALEWLRIRNLRQRRQR